MFKDIGFIIYNFYKLSILKTKDNLWRMFSVAKKGHPQGTKKLVDSTVSWTHSHNFTICFYRYIQNNRQRKEYMQN